MDAEIVSGRVASFSSCAGEFCPSPHKVLGIVGTSLIPR